MKYLMPEYDARESKRCLECGGSLDHDEEGRLEPCENCREQEEAERLDRDEAEARQADQDAYDMHFDAAIERARRTT